MPDLDPRAAEVLRALRDGLPKIIDALREGLPPAGPLWWSTGEVEGETTDPDYPSGRWPIPRAGVARALRRLTKLGLVEHREAPYTKTGKTRDEWRVRENRQHEDGER